MARHADLAAVVAFLLETGIPFAIEKPLGLNSEQVTPLAEVPAAGGRLRQCPWSIATALSGDTSSLCARRHGCVTSLMRTSESLTGHRAATTARYITFQPDAIS